MDDGWWNVVDGWMLLLMVGCWGWWIGGLVGCRMVGDFEMDGFIKIEIVIY